MEMAMATKIETVIAEIMNSLSEMFAEMDAKVLTDTQSWAKARQTALRDFQNSDERKNWGRTIQDTYSLYDRMYAICGGKTWYQIFNYDTAKVVEQKIEKHCKRVVEARNETIARKLTKAGVSEVINKEVGWTKDGFHGVFVVNTDKGQKRVKIQTIYAGGYNIQCAHMRTLVHVR
jgi:hypothetical protein